MKSKETSSNDVKVLLLRAMTFHLMRLQLRRNKSASDQTVPIASDKRSGNTETTQVLGMKTTRKYSTECRRSRTTICLSTVITKIKVI